MAAHELTIASMGHPQHGKSSVMGCLAIALRGREHLDTLLRAIENKVQQLGTPELRYSLIFDLPKQDFSFREGEIRHDAGKTVSRLPGWLGCRIGSRRVMLVDEPGHTQFLRYIVAPVASADVGIVVVDARILRDEYDRIVESLGPACFQERVGTRYGEIPLLLKMDREERERAVSHLRRRRSPSSRKRWIPSVCINLVNYVAMSELFGVRRIVVAVHKMDQAGYEEDVYQGARERFVRMTEFLTENLQLEFVPTATLAAREEDHNIAARSDRMGWYNGPTLVEKLTEMAEQLEVLSRPDGPLRLQVERVSEASGHTKQLLPVRVFGRIDSGRVCYGDEVVFTPADVKAHVKEIRLRDESKFFSEDPYWSDERWEVEKADAGDCVSVALSGKDLETALQRRNPRMHWQGLVMSHLHDRPAVSHRIRARLMIVPPWWLEEKLAGGFNLFYGYEQNSCSLVEPWEPGHDEKWWQAMSTEIRCERALAMDTFQPGRALGKIILEREGFFVAGGTVVNVMPDTDFHGNPDA